MTLPGGPADKLGNRYEKWWTLSVFVRMLQGHAEAIDRGVKGGLFVASLTKVNQVNLKAPHLAPPTVYVVGTRPALRPDKAARAARPHGQNLVADAGALSSDSRRYSPVTPRLRQ